MTEAQEQAAVIEYCDWMMIPIFHIPNGGSRDVREAVNLKRQGVKSGVPDLFVPLARGGRHGLFIEMKRSSPKGRLSENQKEWLERLSEAGYAAEVAYGATEAKEIISEYIEGGKT